MLATILGLVLFLVPFLLIYRFKDKILGFAYILSFVIGFHLLTAVITQFFHVFSYGVVLGINLVVSAIVLTKLNFKELLKNIKGIKIDWILISVIIILFIQLFSVHYNYTGKVTTVVEPYSEVRNMKYVYPYFSDEWYAVSFVGYSIESHNLPLANPLWYNSPFPNLELPFHSFVSEIILLLNLEPLTQYTLLTIFTGMLICLLVYFILRVNKIGRFSSAVAGLSVPYIINGANLPGIWTLVPLIIGIISMLLGFLFMSLNSRKMIWFMAFLTLIFYPPLFVFYIVALSFYFISLKDLSKKEKIKTISAYFAICIVVSLILFGFVYSRMPSLLDSVSHIFSKIFYETFTIDFIPDFLILKVIPIPIILLFGFGMFKIIKRKFWLAAPVLVGLVYWVLYSRFTWRFIIENERVVVTTSILITLIAGWGVHYLIMYLRGIDFIRRYKILKFVQILVLILFLISSFSYTKRDNWQELKLHAIKGDTTFSPASSANNYLHPDDLRLFAGIEEKVFLSTPWKGTVIGIATHNYPLSTKSGTITMDKKSLSVFMNVDCAEKYEIATLRDIDYVYSSEINCTNFELEGVSSEGLYLYEVLRD